MKEQKHDRQTGPAADEAAETLALFAGKLDEATQCAPDAAAQVEENTPKAPFPARTGPKRPQRPPPAACAGKPEKPPGNSEPGMPPRRSPEKAFLSRGRVRKNCRQKLRFNEKGGRMTAFSC